MQLGTEEAGFLDRACELNRYGRFPASALLIENSDYFRRHMHTPY